MYMYYTETVTTVGAEEGTLRLMGPGGDGEGSVEMYSARYGWSSLCTSGWDNDDATVVCNELGYDNGWSNTVIRYCTFHVLIHTKV